MSSDRGRPHEGDGYQYRRGALMGFTVAESFMLIAFALLLLLTLWRFAEAERGKALDLLSPPQLATVNQAAESGVLGDVLSVRDRPPEELRAIAAGAAVVPLRTYEELQEARRLVEEDEIRRLAEAAEKLPPETRRRLVDLVQLEDYRALLERLEALKAFDRSPDLARAVSDLSAADGDRLAQLARAGGLGDWASIMSDAAAAGMTPSDARNAFATGADLKDWAQDIEAARDAGLAPGDAAAALARSTALERWQSMVNAAADAGLSPRQAADALARSRALDKWMEAVSAAEAAGMTPAEAARAIALAESLTALRASASGEERELAEQIRSRTGRLVSEVGGEITEDGDVILPDELLFAAGKATLTPRMKTFLDGFCGRWFEILHARTGLSSIQIEGHASSEWQDLAPDAAYLRNLGLSQSRARAVFAYCLESVSDHAIGAWARSKLAAVGYSSARPVLVDGAEDRARSRRVVFSTDADGASFIERFDAAKAGRQ